MRLIFIFFLNCGLLTLNTYALDPRLQLEKAGIAPVLGTSLDVSRTFIDEKGGKISLQEAIGGKATIFTPVYYNCPNVCGLLLSQLARLTSSLPLRLGIDYNIVTFSFDSADSAALAHERAITYWAKSGDKERSAKGWKFLVGSEDNIRIVMQQAGFKYSKDGPEFAHNPVFMILTPGGAISQYFTDVNVSPWDIKLSLVEASRGEIGSAIDHALLYCFRFDPTKGKYTWAAWNFVRSGVFLCVALSLAFVFLYSRKRR